MLLQMHNRYRTSGVSNKQKNITKCEIQQIQRYDLMCLTMQRKNDCKQTADPTHAKCHNHAAWWYNPYNGPCSNAIPMTIINPPLIRQMHIQLQMRVRFLPDLCAILLFILLCCGRYS
jgi:hypothetical protein